MQHSKNKTLLYLRSSVKAAPLQLFNPEIYPERLSDLISSIIRIPVTVIRALPLQESILEGNALLIMDILVQLEDGSLANVEVQKIPYMFPAERMSCYSSDLVLRQYSRVKGEMVSICILERLFLIPDWNWNFSSVSI